MHEHDTRDDAIRSLENTLSTVHTANVGHIERIERLRQALLAVSWMFDRERMKASPYYPRTLSEDGQAELGLLPGDVDATKQYPLDTTETPDGNAQ